MRPSSASRLIVALRQRVGGSHRMIRETIVHGLVWYLFGTLVITGALDLYLGSRYGAQYTLSDLIMRISMRWPILPLMVGLLLGHFFWPQVPGGAEGIKEP